MRAGIVLNHNGVSQVLALNITFVVLTIVGNEFIRRRDRRGWWIWLPADLLAIVFFALQREWWTMALYVYFALACLAALRDWRGKERRESSGITVQLRQFPAAGVRR